MTVADWFQEVRSFPSDISGHLDYFVELARELDATKIIELGVRAGNSTAAWLYAMQGRGHVWSVDISPAPRSIDIDEWTFICGDDCDAAVLDQLPTDADIVFIDTSHAYEHTFRELRIYRDRVRSGGRILLHDTELEAPELVGPQPPFPVKRAIEEFCAVNKLAWTNAAHCYGLGDIRIP